MTEANIQFQGKADFLTAALRELIITGELEAGEPLRQRELASQFGVSPTRVREALRRLEAEGLVKNDLHRGAIVVEDSEDSEDEVFQVRAVLKSLATRMAAERASEADVEELRALQTAFAALPDGHPELAEANRLFHFRIYDASHSPMLLELLRLLWQSFQHRPFRLRPKEQSVADHEGIVDVLARADQDAAEQRMRQHILRP